jgi:hypothetical protein
VVTSMGPRNAYKDMLDNVVSPITCVSMNHQNQLEQMENGVMFATHLLTSKPTQAHAHHRCNHSIPELVLAVLSLFLVDSAIQLLIDAPEEEGKKLSTQMHDNLSTCNQD